MKRLWGGQLKTWAKVGLRVLRGVLMGGALAVALTLFYWNRIGDPRFYTFLDTDAGSAMARVFGWYASPLERPTSDKAERWMTTDERAVKRAVGRLLYAHGLVDIFDIAYRDVAFCREIEGMTVHVTPPYLVLTDNPVEEVPSRIRALAQAHAGFQRHFGSLTMTSKRRQLSHVLLFSNPADYVAYQQRYAPRLEHTSGFYSPAIDRLVLYEDPFDGQPGRESQTLLTIRHEGAHQFLFAHGVHSRHRIENDWLVEGMATYLETAEAGARDTGRVIMVANALRRDEAFPLREFVDLRQEDGLLAYKPAELAYSEAWTLVHFLMQDPTREHFFSYIEYVRDPKNFRHVRRRPRLDLLAEFLDLTPSELEQEWQAYVLSLIA